jgi:hypothetical protein
MGHCTTSVPPIQVAVVPIVIGAFYVAQRFLLPKMIQAPKNVANSNLANMKKEISLGRWKLRSYPERF